LKKGAFLFDRAMNGELEKSKTKQMAVRA